MKMIIKKYKYLTKALNNNKVLARSSKVKSHHDQSHLLFKLNMKYGYEHQKQQLHRAVNSAYNLFIAVLCVISVLLLPFGCVDAVGYSYTRFVGPVAGPEHRIYVNDVGNVQSVAGNDASSRLDYVAKPEYEFSYGVEDAEAHILHNRNEMRDGDAVKGVYSVVDPDGTLRVVKYTADEVNGFQAEVIQNGISSLYGQKHKDGTPSKTNNNNNYNNYQHHNSQPKLKEAVYNPNLEHQINHYYPQSQYQTPPPSVIYHYNNGNYDNNDDGDIDSGSDYNDDYHQPQYEVREKQNENRNDNNDNEHENGNDGGGEGGGGNKEKDHHDEDNDDEDSDSEDDYDDSEELEDYKDAARSNEAIEESDEYY